MIVNIVIVNVIAASLKEFVYVIVVILLIHKKVLCVVVMKIKNNC